MAAPDVVTITNLDGTFTMNKEESDPFDPILSLQGVGWLIRTAIGKMTVTLHIHETRDAAGNTVIDIEQPGFMGYKGTHEKRVLSGEYNEHTDHVFGHVKGKTSWIKVADLKDSDEDEAFLKSKWLPETANGEAVDSYVESVGNKWIARQIWGFQEIGGVRKYARNIVVRKGKENKKVTLYYDYKGPPPPASA